MSVVLLPKSLRAELERMMNSFWWGKNQRERRVSVVLHGGMAFKKPHLFNMVIVAKQA